MQLEQLDDVITLYFYERCNYFSKFVDKENALNSLMKYMWILDSETNSQPIDKPIKESFVEIIENNIQKNIKKPNTKHIEKLIEDHIAEPIKEPITEPIKEPITEPIKEPITEPNEELIKEPITEPNEEPIKEPIKKPKQTRFSPNEQDSLFWCMTIRHRSSTGESWYKQLKSLKATNMANWMMEKKREMFNTLASMNKNTLKSINHKITLAKINELKCNLLTQPLSCIQGLIICAIYWNTPIYVDLGDKLYLYFVSKDYVADSDVIWEDTNATLLYLVSPNPNPKRTNNPNPNPNRPQYFAVELDMETQFKKIKEMRETYYCMAHYEKPLMAIGNYSTEELHSIYMKIFADKEIDLELKKKQDYYNAIGEFCGKHLTAKIM